jgi:hypothetical protein
VAAQGRLPTASTRSSTNRIFAAPLATTLLVLSLKAPRTQKDNLSQIKQLRSMFDSALIDSIPPLNDKAG